MEQEFSPADINTKINEYKEEIMHFAALLENENQALRAYNIDAVTALLEEKTKLVTSYRAMVAYFIKNQEKFKTADNEAKQSLKELSLKLDALMKENDVAIWAHHGRFCSGDDFDLTFGLMHTVEKSAEILVKMLSMSPDKRQTISPQHFRDLAKAFKVTLPEKFLYGK